MAAEEVERFDRQPGRVHRDTEERDALVLLHVGVRPCCEPDVVSVPGERGPGLLAVDDELVAVADGSALQRSEVGAGIGFGVADTEGDLPAGDLRQEEVLLLLGAVLHQGRADGVDREHRDRCADGHRLVEHHELFDGGVAATAVFLGPPDRQPTVASHLADDLSVHRAGALFGRERIPDLGREQFVVVVAQLLSERLLFLVVPDVHASKPLQKRAEPTIICTPGARSLVNRAELSD